MSSKRPVANEDGNWACEDPTCLNVNYPRRTECHKCGKKRGPAGDAVVNDFNRRGKHMRIGGDYGGPGSTYIFPQPADLAPPTLYYSAMGGNGYYPPAPHVALLGSGEGPGSFAGSVPGSFAGAVASQYAVSHEMGAPAGSSGSGTGRRSALSAAAEGKRLAEQLVASFATSADPIADAGECLASATLWLQTMKSRMPHQLPPSSPSSTPGSAPLPAASSPAPPSSLPSLSSYHFPPPLTSTTQMYSHLDGLGGLRSQGYNPLGGFPLPGGPYGGMGYLPQGPPPRQNHGGTGSHSYSSHMPSKVSSLKAIPADIKFEDYKDKPSDFLKEFGDPAALIPPPSARGGPSSRPLAGENGNWDCKKCANVNFPRRLSCHQCAEKRGEAGDEIVRNYVKQLIEDAKKASQEAKAE